MMPRNAGDYVKSWGAALIRGAASNPEFTVVAVGLIMFILKLCKLFSICQKRLALQYGYYSRDNTHICIH